MLSLWFYPSWLPSRHSSCPLAPHKRGQKAISFQQTMMWVGARVPLLGFQDSQTEYCIIVYYNDSGYKTSDIVFIFAFDWSSFRISTRDCLQSVQVGNFQAVAFKLWNHIANGHIFIYILIFLFVLSCIFSGFECVYCLSKGDQIAPFLDFETMPIQILKSTFVRNICNLSSEVYRDIEVSFFFKISIPLRSCLVFSYLKWRIISPFARSGDGIFTSIYHANSAAKVSMTPKLREFKEEQRCIYFRLSKKNICRILFIIMILQ